MAKTEIAETKMKGAQRHAGYSAASVYKFRNRSVRNHPSCLATLEAKTVVQLSYLTFFQYIVPLVTTCLSGLGSHQLSPVLVRTGFPQHTELQTRCNYIRSTIL